MGGSELDRILDPSNQEHPRVPKVAITTYIGLARYLLTSGSSAQVTRSLYSLLNVHSSRRTMHSFNTVPLTEVTQIQFTLITSDIIWLLEALPIYLKISTLNDDEVVGFASTVHPCR